MYDAKNTVVQAEGRMINDGVIQSALMYLPNLPAYEENGDYARSAMIRMKTDWGMNFPENPLAIANELDINEKMSRHNLNLNLVYEFLPDLKLSARLRPDSRIDDLRRLLHRRRAGLGNHPPD